MEKNKKLIVISGITGSGKSSLAKALYDKIDDSVLLSVDEIKEWINDKLLYCNVKEKKYNKELAFSWFETLLENHMKRESKTIIVEYPFRKKWEFLFRRLTDTYKYKFIVINVYGSDFNSLWAHLKERNSGTERHLSHSRMESYNVRNSSWYVSENKLDYDETKKDYDSEEFTSLKGDCTYNFINKYKIVDIEKLIYSWMLKE